jgi:hypothetical protein
MDQLFLAPEEGLPLELERLSKDNADGKEPPNVILMFDEIPTGMDINELSALCCQYKNVLKAVRLIGSIDKSPKASKNDRRILCSVQLNGCPKECFKRDDRKDRFLYGPTHPVVYGDEELPHAMTVFEQPNEKYCHIKLEVHVGENKFDHAEETDIMLDRIIEEYKK